MTITLSNQWVIKTKRRTPILHNTQTDRDYLPHQYAPIMDIELLNEMSRNLTHWLATHKKEKDTDTYYAVNWEHRRIGYLKRGLSTRKRPRR